MSRVLILQNAPLFTAGNFEEELKRKQIPYDYHLVYEKGAPSLDLVSSYGGFIVLGGPLRFRVDQVEKSPALTKQIFFLRACLDVHKPILAVGQGSTLLAQAQGAWVARAPQAEIGWVKAEIYPDYSRNSVIYSEVETKKFPAFVWYDTLHGFPPQGYWYAYSPNFRHLSTGIHGNCYLFDFHPEINESLLNSWLKEHKSELSQSELAEQIQKGSAEGIEFAKDFSRKIIHAFESFLK